MPEPMKLFIGRNPLYTYEQFGINALMQTGQVVVLARGQLISKAVLVAHRLEQRYQGVHIATEETYMEQLPDDGRASRSYLQRAEEAGFNDESLPAQRPHTGPRDVPVYKARLIFQKEDKAPAKAGESL